MEHAGRAAADRSIVPRQQQPGPQHRQPLHLHLVRAENLVHSVECSLDLGDVEARLEAVRRDLPGLRDDRLGAVLVHALDDQLEQIPHVATALLWADCVVVRLMASLERGSSTTRSSAVARTFDVSTTGISVSWQGTAARRSDEGHGAAAGLKLRRAARMSLCDLFE